MVVDVDVGAIVVVGGLGGLVVTWGSVVGDIVEVFKEVVITGASVVTGASIVVLW